MRGHAQSSSDLCCGRPELGQELALACITGITFPVKSGICTKTVIVVECHHDQTLGHPVFEIQDQASPEKYHSVDLSDLTSEIENIQNKLLDSKGKSGSTSTLERPKISQKEIRVKVSHPSLHQGPAHTYTASFRGQTRQRADRRFGPGQRVRPGIGSHPPFDHQVRHI